MAHIIARSPVGPRAAGKVGADTYENTILLCPSCHRTIDKAPNGEFSIETLQTWKSEHERKVKSIWQEKVFETAQDLKKAVSDILMENKNLWSELGPKSETARLNPTSNLSTTWQYRKLDTIIPNNQRIVNLIERNLSLLTNQEKQLFFRFKNHAIAFEQHQYDRLDSYPQFPEEFEMAFNND